ncbi:MAG: hypothetical protein KUG68_05135 [Flavobacteriaceae bacterium]|nr:hypothetical protein [Flavobacteriaceae bacterium]
MNPLKMLIGLLIFSSIISCKSDDDVNCCDDDYKLIVKFKFDPNQERLNNFGLPSDIPIGNAAQSPDIGRMSANYIELAPSALTPLGEGVIIFNGAETNAGGAKAIDFQSASFAGNNEVFFEMPLNEIPEGEYNWVRISLAYQEGNVDVLTNGIEIEGTLASFVGYNTYITSFDLNNTTVDVNENKLQGFWAFEALGFLSQGQAPEGAITVPNPLFDTSPIPQGSCVVTGQFENSFNHTGIISEDKELTLSFSINNSFEWTEVNSDGKFEPAIGEQVVDMGLRGLIPAIN